MKQRVGDIAAIITLLTLICIFFFRLFYPEPRLFVTPDFGRSDAWHFSYPTKVSLARALSQNTLPLWEPLMGGGFPLFAEGQVGALFLPNIILFRLLPEVFAYNSALTLTFVTLAFGTYLYLRALKRSVLGSFLAAAIVTFSGLPVLQLTHITLLQGMTLLPFILWASAKKRVVVTAALLAQQIFAGFPQATFVTLILAFAQAGYVSYGEKSWIPVLKLALSTVLGLLLSAVQLIPSYEFLTQMSSPHGFDYFTASFFSFPIAHFKTFLSPYALGNPKLGTYPPFTSFDGSIFWENTAYIGIVPLIFTLFFFLQKGGVWKAFWAGVLVGGLLLSLGKHAPTYILYTFWPFTLFRVPSRFLWIVSLSLAAGTAFGWDALMTHRVLARIRAILFTSLLAISLLQLWSAWSTYHLLKPAKDWTTFPKLTTRLAPSARIWMPDVGIAYNKAFATGWTDATAYEALRVLPAPDANILPSLQSHTAYAGRYLRRNTLSESLLLSETTVGESAATISATGEKLLSLYGVTTVITTEPLTTVSLVAKETIELTPTIKATIYDNPNAVPRFRLVAQETSASTIKELAQIVADQSFHPLSSTIVEAKHVASTSAAAKNLPHALIHVLIDRPTRVVLEIRENTVPSLLVTTDSYYPGWKAKVDNMPVPIVPTNISQRAIFVPAGDHIIEMNFSPFSLRIGALVSLGAGILTVGLVVYPGLLSLLHIGKTIHPLFRHHRRTRAKL